MHIEDAVCFANVAEPNPVVNGLGAQMQLLGQLRDGHVFALAVDPILAFVFSRLIHGTELPVLISLDFTSASRLSSTTPTAESSVARRVRQIKSLRTPTLNPSTHV